MKRGIADMVAQLLAAAQQAQAQPATA